MSLKDIKKRIFRENLVTKIFESIGCVNISDRGVRVEAGLPLRYESDNNRAVQCKNDEYLSCTIWNRPDFDGGDIFCLVSYVFFNKKGRDEINKNLSKSMRFICNIFGWTEYINTSSASTEKKKDPLSALRGLKKSVNVVEPNTVIPEEILDYYDNSPCWSWYKDEGLSYETQMKYGVGFDLETKRITIPLRNKYGQLIGVKGRILHNENSDKKYMFLFRCKQRIEWFNMHIAKEHIEKQDEIFIFEAEKSCMKTYQWGKKNTLAIGSSKISKEQAKQVLKMFGEDVKINLCYDKGIDFDEVRKCAETLFNAGLKNIYAIIDIDNILPDKHSPVDLGKDVFENLVENFIFKINIEKIDNHDKL